MISRTPPDNGMTSADLIFLKTLSKSKSLDNIFVIADEYYSLNFPNTKVPLVPPKPKEFVSPTSIFISLAVLGT